MQTVSLQHADDIALAKGAIQTVHLHPDDNVAIAKVTILENTRLSQYGGLTVKASIPAITPCIRLKIQYDGKS
jgi:hypothetical protein